MTLTFLILPLVGIFVGFLAGLLGLGGGIIVVPSLLLIFPLLGIMDSIHLAVGTSFATVIITLAASLYSHLQQTKPDFIFKLAVKFVPGVVMGALFGSYLAKILPGNDMAIIFGIIVWLLALRVFLIKEIPLTDAARTPGSLPAIGWVILTSFVMGTISELMGVGGAIFLISYLGVRGYSMEHATTIAPMVAIPMAVMGVITYMVLGLSDPGVPHWSTGYVYWPAVLGICMTSIIVARFSTKLAHKMSSKSLRIIFVIVLGLIGVKMIFWH